MKENRKLLKEVLEDIRHDMTDEEVLSLLAGRQISVKPENAREKYTLGQRAADTIAKFAGSWAFIFSFTGVLVLWMIVNAVLALKAFDPYPFILLNLVLSCVAAIQAPLIMMSQNRQEEKDRHRAENDYKVNLKTEIMIEALYDKVNAILTIEGGEAFGDDISSVQRFAELGVRVAALIWNNDNLLAHPAVKGSDNGLTPFGWQVTKELRKYHIALDISHLNERGSWELMESNVPPMASHSCARALCDHPRNLTDEQLRALFHAGGYVGVNFYPVFLKESGQATVDDLIDHIAYMCDLGGERCVAWAAISMESTATPKGCEPPTRFR